MLALTYGMLRAVGVLAIVSSFAFAANPCGTCHPAEVKAYAETGMGSSISTTVNQPAGKFTQPYSKTTFSIDYTGPVMHQHMTRDGLSVDYPVSYVIGSGHRAFGYLIRINDYLFQSPATYYTRKNAWDVAPAYAKNAEPDFNRPVTAECLFCHSGTVNHVRGTVNRFADPAVSGPITCERCHGVSDKHIARPSRLNIVNPARLAPELRDSVCEQCHLAGEARILNPSKAFADWTPGEPLENVLTAYVAAVSGDKPLKVISQSEGLRLSACWRKSGQRLWCGTCHNPHLKLVQDGAYYREKCLTCHAATLPRQHQQADANCIGCHMRSRETIDGAHTAFTDHQIRIPTAAPDSAKKPVNQLAPWRAPLTQFAVRNEGLAYLSIGERDGSSEMINKAFPLLVDAQKQFPKDADVTAGLALVLYFKGLNKQAASAFELTSTLRPDVRFFRDAAAAWRAAGNSEKAIWNLDRAIKVDPSDENAYRMLADVFRDMGDGAAEARVLDRYLAFRPGSIEFRRRRLR